MLTFLIINQGFDNVTQSCEGPVDLGSLYQSIASSFCLRLTFASGQVHEVQLAYSELRLLSLYLLGRFDIQGENSVTAGTLVVHFCTSDVSVGKTQL